jgi:hypothetical protein
MNMMNICNHNYNLNIIVSSKGVSEKEAWDKHAGISLVDASIAHCHYWSLRVFVDALKGFYFYFYLISLVFKIKS